MIRQAAIVDSEAFVALDFCASIGTVTACGFSYSLVSATGSSPDV